MGETVLLQKLRAQRDAQFDAVFVGPHQFGAEQHAERLLRKDPLPAFEARFADRGFVIAHSRYRMKLNLKG